MRLAIVLALLLAAPALAQEERPSRFVAAGWCPVVSSGGEEGAPDQPAEGEGAEQGEQVADQEEDELGCDVGVGVDLFGRTFASGRLSLVAVIGTSSVGGGVAWTVKDWTPGGARVSVAAGLVASYGERGIDASRHAFALGVTLGLAGRAGTSPR